MSKSIPLHELTGLTPEERRQELLDRFSEHPTDDRIWQQAYDLVRADGDGVDDGSIASDIPTEELTKLADAVRNTPQTERYDLVASFASNGKRWFDVLETFGSDRMDQDKADIIRSWVRQASAKFHRALDLGTGTGRSLKALDENADQVFGVDRNPALLAIAKEKAGKGTELVQGEVDKLPFADDNFDLATSSGLTGSLDKKTLSGFYRELARVLILGGMYIELSPWPFDGYVSEQRARITASSKAMLADMIVDTVSGCHLADHLDAEKQIALLEELGLKMEHYDAPSNDGTRHNLLTVITKI